MNLEEVKEVLYDITALFFQKATILWSEQINTKPFLPYITLKVGSIQKTAFPLIDEDGGRYYPCHTTVEFNLYTKGKPIILGEDKVTSNYINTATSDLMQFFLFVESESITDKMAEKGIEVTLLPPIRDLTELQNDSKYRYRAMAEATVTFVEEANGSYGVSGMIVTTNSSGGGTPEMAKESIKIIKEVEINKRTKGGKIVHEKSSTR